MNDMRPGALPTVQAALLVHICNQHAHEVTHVIYTWNTRRSYSVGYQMCLGRKNTRQTGTNVEAREDAALQLTSGTHNTKRTPRPSPSAHVSTLVPQK